MRKNPYSKTVNVRISEKQLELAKKYADVENKHMSEFFRDVVVDYLMERENLEVK